MLKKIRTAILERFPPSKQTKQAVEVKTEKIWEQTPPNTPQHSREEVRVYSSFISKKENILFRNAVENGVREKALEYAKCDEAISDQPLISQCINNKWDDVLIEVFQRNPELCLYANKFIDQITENGIDNFELDQLLQEMKEKIPLPQQLKEWNSDPI